MNSMSSVSSRKGSKRLQQRFRVMAQNFAENMYRDVLSIRNLVGHNETFLTTDSGPWFKRNFKKFEPGYLSGSILHRDIRTFYCFTYFFLQIIKCEFFTC